MTDLESEACSLTPTADLANCAVMESLIHHLQHVFEHSVVSSALCDD